VAALLGLSIPQASALAGGCACNPDVNNSGSVTLVDTAAVFDCARGFSCAGCINSCDIDCSGTVDMTDVSMAYCGSSACCNQPVGACTGMSNEDFGECAVFHESTCSGTSGTYHGDGTICVNGQPVEVPAASTWALLILTLSTTIAATVILTKSAATS
jgi:hypothetical protein